MSNEEPTPKVQRRRWLAGIAAFAVLAVVTIVVLASGGDDSDDAPDASAGSAATTGADEVDSTVSATAAPPTTADNGPAGTAVAGTAVTGTAVTGTTVPTQTTLLGATSVPGVTVPFVPGSLATVPVNTVVPAPPVAIGDEADAGTGMTFRLAQLEAVKGEATGPGEIAGPAVRVTVVATNDSASPVLLEGAVVDVIYGQAKTSASPLSGPGVVRFEGEVAPGGSATGVYVFDVPVDQRGAITVLVSYLASVPPVVFEGAAPTS